MTKIKKITVSNLKAISSQTADFNGCTAIITGKNNSGKTSFLHSLADRLRSIKQDLILKQGEKEGFYEMELTNGEKITWTFDVKGKEKMTLITDRNIKISITKEISQTYFPKIFDVDKFLTDEPGKQRKQIEKIAGIDFDDLNKKLASAVEERLFAKRKLAEKEAQRIQFEPEWLQTERPTELLEKELHGIGEHNLRNKNVTDAVELKKQQRIKISADILELEGKIAELKKKDGTLITEIDKGDVWLAEGKNKIKDPAVAVALKERIKDIQFNNNAVLAETAYEKAVKELNECEKSVKTFEQDKKDALKSSNLPEGFEFDGDTVKYNGFPFTKQNLSSSAIYIGALKLASIGLGEVKTLFFDASYLDKFNLAEIGKWADDHKLQLLIERPSWEGGEIAYEIIENAN